jgi:xanthine dehydrogenase accessory factor
MSIFQTAANLEKTGKEGVICTIIRSSGSTPRHETSKMIVFPDGSIQDTIGGGELEVRVIKESLAALKDGKTRLLTYNYVDPSKGDVGVCGGSVDVYMEPIMAKPTLVIIGSGHVGKALCHLAHWLNFRVVIADDRPEFCSEQFIPEADERICFPATEIPTHLVTNSKTIIVLTTRGNNIDIELLPSLIKMRWYYLGIIGSIRRWEVTKKAILEQGVKPGLIKRIHSPIGLELNAESPEEIAVSIMAEILMIKNQGTGKNMKVS